MNTVFNRCRVLMSRKRVHLLAEMLCLIAVASAFLVISPLAQAKKGASGGGGCGCNNNCAQANGGSSSAANKPRQAVLFDNVVTGISQTGPLSPTVSGITAQLSKVFVLNKQNQWAWVTVTLRVNGTPEHFMAEAFFGNRNKPVVELAEIQPPSDPNDPTLLAILSKHQLYSLTGLTGSTGL
jgi:hypothetical protein